MAEPTRIAPAPRPPRRPPRWTWAALAVALVASFAGGHNAPAWTMLLWLPGLAAAFVLALRLEERVTAPTTHAAFYVRLAVTVAALAAGAGVNVVVAVVIHPLLLILGFDEGAYLVAQLFVFWFLSAVVGAVPVVLAGGLGGRIFGGFRRRVQLSVIVLVAVSVAVAVLAAVTGLTLVDAVKHGERHFLLGRETVAGLDITPRRFADDVVPIIDSPAVIVLLASLVGALYGIPAVLSAAAKIADSVMERVSPLAVGFDRLAGGERDIVVEEGGARELVHIIRRFNMLVTTLALAERMERAFGRYVSTKVLSLIRSRHGDAVLPASTREASVFFADIRGFTSMSEKLSPQQVVAMLNRYFERVVSLVNDHDGYLNKFIGDAVVVVWNGPIDQPDHAARATRCAVDLQRVVAEMNAAGAFPEIGEMKIGVGVATGPMVCGNVGGAAQMEYTVIGDTVNLAARLTSKAPAGEVWVSEATVKALPADIRVASLASITVKGKEQPVTPFRAWPSGEG